MTKLIVIIGITGNQGGSVADVFLKESGWNIRAISRNPAKAKGWTDKGVEVVKGDLDDKDSLISAFKGANAIFAVTDFWHPFGDPSSKEKLKPGQSINEYCYELEVQQGKKIAQAAATVEGLERFIFSSLSKSKYWSKGKYTGVYHFDSKADVVDYIKQELPKLAEKMSVVQIGMFMTNWKMSSVRPTKQADGTFRIASVGAGNAPIPQMYTQKDTGYFVRALIQSPPGLNVLAYGSMESWEEYLKVFCKVHNVKYGGYDELSLEDMDKMMPGGLGMELGEMFAYVAEFGYDGGDPSIISAKDLKVPCPTTSLEEYFKIDDFSSLL